MLEPATGTLEGAAIPKAAARRSGGTRSIVAVGPMLGLLAGAALAEFAGPRPVFLILGLIALIAIPLARRVPEEPEGHTAPAPRFALPAPLDVWSFVFGLTLDGLFVIELALLAAAELSVGAGLAAGAALALRYAAEILLSPAGCALAHRYGARRLLVALSLAASAALALLGWGGVLLWPAAVATVLLRALLQPLPGPVAAEQNPGPGGFRYWRGRQPGGILVQMPGRFWRACSCLYFRHRHFGVVPRCCWQAPAWPSGGVSLH